MEYRPQYPPTQGDGQAPREEMAHPHLCLNCHGVINVWCMTGYDAHDFMIRCESCDLAFREIVAAAREWRYWRVNHGWRSADAKAALERLDERLVRTFGVVAEI